MLPEDSIVVFLKCTIMAVSGVSFIANAPANPMQFFASWRDEVNRNDPYRFNDAMNVASIDDIDGVLNRNVALRKVDDEGLTFVTERASKKYKNFMNNSTIAAAFLWMYMINGTHVTKQVRITGTVSEVSEKEIAEFYEEEDLTSKIRIKICPIGAEVNWNELKARHDQVLKDYQEGREKLPQTKSYTALKIIPKKFYFYLAGYNEIADRVKYELKDGKWINYHIAS